MAFFDGQNFLHATKKAFGVSFPIIDPIRIVESICEQQDWSFVSPAISDFMGNRVRFYTGVPAQKDNPAWSNYWQTILPTFGRNGIEVTTRSVRYRQRKIRLNDGTDHIVRIGDEKGIDVRMALDVVRSAYTAEFDIAVLFSQDQDFSEVADELRRIAREQKRWIRVVSAFPVGKGTTNARGINRTDWIPIDRRLFDISLTDYKRTVRPESRPEGSSSERY